ncbi:MAG: hypothetical protein LQ337_003443 [Flavoplaca oasis]|nr:MAG: hypothetical protein LQ337_003443 [Flavoplaca oasis]
MSGIWQDATGVEEDGGRRKRRKKSALEAQTAPKTGPTTDDWESQLRAAALSSSLSPQSKLAPAETLGSRVIHEASSGCTEALPNDTCQDDRAPPTKDHIEMKDISTLDEQSTQLEQSGQPRTSSPRNVRRSRKVESGGLNITMPEIGPQVLARSKDMRAKPATKVRLATSSPETLRHSTRIPDDHLQETTTVVNNELAPRKMMKVRANGRLTSPKSSELNDRSLVADSEEGSSSMKDVPRASKDAQEKQTKTRQTAPKKPMKIRPDGTLVSPSSYIPPDRSGKKPRGRPKKSADAAVKMVVVMKYGMTDSARYSIGQRLQDILSKTNEKLPTSSAGRPVDKPKEPPTTTHPFFLGKLAKKSEPESKSVDSKDRLEPSTNKQDESEYSSSPVKRASPGKPTVKASATPWACMGAFSQGPAILGGSVTRKPRGIIDTIWPPQGMVHVRQISDNHPAFSPKKVLTFVKPSPATKSKDVRARITEKEEVLYRYRALAKSSKSTKCNSGRDYSQPESLRLPKRRLMTGLGLQRAYQERFAAQSEALDHSTHEEIENDKQPDVAWHQTIHSHPALLRLYDRIVNSQTAFDRFECETQNWQQKYAPRSAEEILQPGREAMILRDWLRSLAVNSIENGGKSVEKVITTTGMAKKQGSARRKKKRHRAEELDGFVVSSDEEANEMGEINDGLDMEPSQARGERKPTEIRTHEAANLNTETASGQKSTNAIIMSGPCGCGKTAAIYAVARELGYEVFEINAGSRRSGKDIIDKVGDMSRNHLVSLSRASDTEAGNPLGDDDLPAADALKQDIESGRQSTMSAFLQPKKIKRRSPKKSKPSKGDDANGKRSKRKPQRQSVILLEEVDVLFEEDRQFWTTTLELIVQSKRPVILTCNEERLLPLDDLPLFGILRFREPPEQLAREYLSLLACNEGHLLSSEAVSALYRAKGFDLRASIMELQFFCQMSIGDTKGGLEWLLIGAAAEPGEAVKQMRVVSDGTYVKGMGWVSQESAATESGQQIIKEVDHVLAVCNEWGIDMAGYDDFLPLETLSGLPANSKDRKRTLKSLDLAFDALSAADSLGYSGFRDGLRATVEVSAPPMSDKQRASYVEGTTLVEADLRSDASGVIDTIASALRIVSRRTLLATADLLQDRPLSEQCITDVLPRMVEANQGSGTSSRQRLHATFLPLSKPSVGPSAAKGPFISCLDSPVAVVLEDIAPYVRSIVSYDLRLEEHRKRLDQAFHGERSSKRARTTRASRAALEGGSKANTRRERWFPANTNFQAVLESGGTGWQNEVVSKGRIGGIDETDESGASRRLKILKSKGMSLFGSSPPEEPSQSTRSGKSQSLFDDDRAAGAANSSLFDDGDGTAPSPWDMPTPKKSAKGDMVKTLLPATSVPESYVDAFDLVLEAGFEAGAGSVTLAGAKKLFESSGLDADEQARIVNLVTGGQEPSGGLGRSEFNVLVALIGLAQGREELTLDGVDERRRNLPEPSLPATQQMRTAKVSENTENASSSSRDIQAPLNEPAPETSPPKSKQLGRDSLENLDADPWGSPALHKGHTHTNPVRNDATPSSNGVTAARPLVGAAAGNNRTTSAFTTHSELPDSASSTLANDDTTTGQTDGSAGGWGSFGNPGQGGLGNGFGGDDQGNQSSRPVSRSLGGGRTNRHIEETVTVTLLPEKEGMFMFQHRNYEVKSARRGSTVIRRYSDFVWLLDCLHKKYPFRQLPLLPPKRVAVNGRHLATDSNFIEKRRRGLVRFTNALVRHPVLGQEELVKMFLTVPTELAGLRKQVSSSVQEEFTGRRLPPDLEDSLPTNLLETFDTSRSGVRQSAEAYINLCTLLERLMKRNQGIAADNLRFSHALTNLTEFSPSTYATDTNDVPLLNEGISSTAKHLATSQTLLEEEARVWDEGVLEDFKKQRDTLVSVRDMFDRRDRYDKDNIPYLERRIESNEQKLAGLMNRPSNAPVKPGEQEKLEQAVRTDKQSIVDQHARSVFIKECLRDELQYFQQSQYHVSKLHQEWSQERVKYAELQVDNWRALSEEVENMPTGD